MYDELLRSAKQRREFAAVLDAVFEDPVVGRALLISHSELFEQLRLKDGEMPFHFRARGLPYLSHAYSALLSSWNEHCISLNDELKRKQKAVTEPIEQLQESTWLADRLSLAVLAILQKNPILLELENRAEPVDIAQLRTAVRDYKDLDFSALQSLFVDALPGFLERPKQRKTINRLTMNLDSLFHISNPDGARRDMVWITASRFVRLLRTRRVSEGQWRALVIALANDELLEPSSCLYLWCRDCPDVGFTVPTILTRCDLPPSCPCCNRQAHSIAALVPAGPLQGAIFAPDGLLGVAVAWHLRKGRFRFEAAKHTGITEFDFLVTTKLGPILLECKMLHALSENLMANLWASRNQLRDHVNALKTQGIMPYKAACIVNIPVRELHSLLKRLSQEAVAEFHNIDGEVISYERFPKWLESQFAKIDKTK